MLKFFLCSFVAITLFHSSFAVELSFSKKEFCQNHRSKSYARDLLATNPKARLGFKNQGGLVNGGVCWWHSRLTRNASYLAYYSPNKPSPSAEKVAKIVHQLRKGNGPVEIPGYDSFSSFTAWNENIVQEELDKWQKADGVLRAQWAVGLWGGSSISPSKLRKKMDELYNYVNKKKNIAYQVLQIPGIMAHAWLVVGMEKNGNGYDLKVLDSNFPLSTYIVEYQHGMSYFTPHYGEYVPRLGKKREERKLRKTVKKFCR